jgi:uncharacterized membrane protein
MEKMTSRRAELIIGNLLRTGVLIAATVALASGIFYLLQHHADAVRYRVFASEPAELRSIPGIFRGATSLNARALIQFGLLLLILTPVLRVVFAAFAFALERDRMYVVVSLIVLGILLYSLMHAL